MPISNHPAIYSRQGHYQQINVKYAISYKPGEVCLDIYDADTSIVEFSVKFTPDMANQVAAKLLNAASMAKFKEQTHD